jgi:hypothetical protein
MIIEVNRVLIDKPDLYCIFPGDKYVSFPGTPFNSLKPQERVQAKSLIDLFFSTFEAFFDFHRHLNWRNFNWRTKADKEYLKEWEDWILEFFKDCPEARRVWNSDKRIYSKYFCKCMAPIVAQAEAASLAERSEPGAMGATAKP